MSRRPSATGARGEAAPPFSRPVAVHGLSRKRAHPFDLAPVAEEAAAIARFLGIEALRALRFRGELVPAGDESWRVEGQLVAEVVQSCVVTLESVTQTIDEAVAREYVPEADYRPAAEIDVDPEAEDEPDPFGSVIDPGQLALESLALALDPYPRAKGVPHAEFRAAPPGVEPLDDQDLKPFAKLAVLKEKLGGGSAE